MFKTTIDKFQNFRQNEIALYLNHLLVIYAFLLPISERGKSAIFFTILVLFLIRGNFKEYFLSAIRNKVVQAMFLFFIVHLLWMYGSDNIKEAKNTIDDMKYLLFPLIFISFLDKRFFVRILTAFIFGMFFSEVISYLIHFQILPYELSLFGKELYHAQAMNNPTPFLDHARYGVFLTITVGFLLYNLLYIKNSILIKSITLVFLLTASYNLSLIGGRIGYVSCFVIISYLILRKYKAHLLRTILLLATVLFLIFNIFYHSSELFEQRINQSVDSFNKIIDQNDFQSSIGLRLGIWIYSCDVIRDNFILGVGTGDDLDEVKSRVTKEDSFLKNLSHVHNEYFKNLLQFGILGFIVYLNIFYQVLKYPTENSYRKDMTIIVTLVILTATLTSILGSNIYLPFYVTIICSAIANKETLLDKFKVIDLKIIVIYTIIILLSLLIAFLQ